MEILETLAAIARSIIPIFRGTGVTVALTFSLLAIGLIMGLPLALGQVYGNKIISTIIVVYERIFRSIPALVLLFLFYFGPATFGIHISPFLVAILALGFRSSAYQSQIFRGAIQSIGQGQMIAARSLGMSKLKAIIHIILPLVLRRSIPSWSNEYSSVLKDTALAFAIGVIDLNRWGWRIAIRTQDPIIVFLVIGVIYFFLTLAGTRFLRWLEKEIRIPGFQSRGTTG